MPNTTEQPLDDEEVTQMNLIRRLAARFGWVRLNSSQAQMVHNLLVQEHSRLIDRVAAYALAGKEHHIHAQRTEEEAAEAENLINYVFAAWRW